MIRVFFFWFTTCFSTCFLAFFACVDCFPYYLKNQIPFLLIDFTIHNLSCAMTIFLLCSTCLFFVSSQLMTWCSSYPSCCCSLVVTCSASSIYDYRSYSMVSFPFSSTLFFCDCPFRFLFMVWILKVLMASSFPYPLFNSCFLSFFIFLFGSMDLFLFLPLLSPPSSLFLNYCRHA